MKFFVEMFVKVAKVIIQDSQNSATKMLLKQPLGELYDSYIQLVKDNNIAILAEQFVKDIESKNIDFDIFSNNLVDILQIHRYTKEAIELQEEYISTKLMQGIDSITIILEYNRLVNICKEAHMMDKAIKIATDSVVRIEKELKIEESMLNIVIGAYLILAELKQIESYPHEEVMSLCSSVFRYIENSKEIIHQESKDNFLFRAYYLLTLSSMENDKYLDTIKYANKAFEVGRNISLEIVLSRIFTIKTQVANAYLNLDNPQKALEVADEALKLKEKEPLLNIFEIYRVKSLILNKLKEYDMAIKLAKEIVPKATTEVEFVNIYKALIDIYDSKNDIENMELYTKKLVDFQEQNSDNNHPVHLSSLYELALKSYSKNDFNLAKNFALKMLNLVKERDDFKRVHRVLVDIAIASGDWVMFDRYLKPLLRVDLTTELRIIVDKHMQKDEKSILLLGDKLLPYTKTEKDRIKIYHMIINCYMRKKEYSRVENLIGKLENSMEDFRSETEQYIDICLILKDYYFAKGENRKANNIMDKLNDYLELNSKKDESSFLVFRISIKYNRAEQYKKIKQFDDAEKELLSALSLIQSISSVDELELAKCYNSLASLYLLQQEYTKSIEYASKSLSLMGENISLMSAHSYNLIHRSYRNLGNTEEAKKNLAHEQRIKESLNDAQLVTA